MVKLAQLLIVCVETSGSELANLRWCLWKPLIVSSETSDGPAAEINPTSPHPAVQDSPKRFVSTNLIFEDKGSFSFANSRTAISDCVYSADCEVEAGGEEHRDGVRQSNPLPGLH